MNMVQIDRDLILDELGRLEADFLNDIDSEDVCQCFKEVRQLVYMVGKKYGLQKKDEDLNSICAFSKNECFDNDVCRHQLRALWTAYCLKYSLDPDTVIYDNDIMTVWSIVEKYEPDTADWSSFDSFDLYMGAYLC